MSCSTLEKQREFTELEISQAYEEMEKKEVGISKLCTERKQLEPMKKESIDESKENVRIGKTCTLVAIIFICIASSVAWMLGPFLVYSRQNVEAVCSPQPYKGVVCRDVLKDRTLCFDGGDLFSYGSPTVLQYLREVSAAQQLQIAQQNGTRCVMMTDICLSTFGLTSSISNASLNDLEMCLNSTPSTGVEYPTGFANRTSCSERFYYNVASGLCKPTCSVFNDGNQAVTNGLYFFGIFGCMVAFITSGFNYKVMKKFPSILLIYWLLSGVAYYITNVVDCCTTSDYFENYNYPSPLCQFRAFLNIFLAYLMVVFPLAHTTILLWSVWFPYSSKNVFGNKRKMTYIHAFVLLTSFLVPCSVCACLITAYLSESTDGNTFYFSFIPFYGMCGAIAALVGLTTWKLMKEEVAASNYRRCSKCCAPEWKLAAVFIYVIILFGTTVAVHMLETYRTYDYVDDYFLCETLGTETCRLDPDHLNIAIDAFAAFHTLVFSLSPYASLIYIMPVHLVKKSMKRWTSKPTDVTV